MSIWLFCSLFLLSFLPVWIVVLIRAIWSICMETQPHCAEWGEVILLPVIVIGAILVVHFCFRKEGASNPIKAELVSISQRRNAPIEFLLSNVLAFVAFDYTKGIEALLMFSLLLVLGVACWRFHGLFWNFWLACLGYREYECHIKVGDEEEIAYVISKRSDRLLDKSGVGINFKLHRLDQFGLCRYDGEWSYKSSESDKKDIPV